MKSIQLFSAIAQLPIWGIIEFCKAGGIRQAFRSHQYSTVTSMNKSSFILVASIIFVLIF